MPSNGTSPASRRSSRSVLGLDLPVDDWAKEEGIADEEMRERVERRADEHMAAKVGAFGPEVMRYVEKAILLQTLDHLWREHIVMLDHLRQVIGLRGYGQRDPLNEYKAEAFELFETMSQQPARGRDRAAHARRDRAAAAAGSARTTLPLMEAHKVDPTTGEDEMALAMAGAERWRGTASAAARRRRSAAAARSAEAPSAIRKDPTSWGKVGRNEACPCGSGKKFKHCHGRYA